jgi:hypothetical protein
MTWLSGYTIENLCPSGRMMNHFTTQFNIIHGETGIYRLSSLGDATENLLGDTSETYWELFYEKMKGETWEDWDFSAVP